MKELLERWKKKEPKWAKHAKDLIPTDDEYHLGAWAHSGAFVQIVVQQAIESHGWQWSVSGPDYRGIVNYGRVIIKSGDTAVEALLSAYLDALEAVEE